MELYSPRYISAGREANIQNLKTKCAWCQRSVFGDTSLLIPPCTYRQGGKLLCLILSQFVDFVFTKWGFCWRDKIFHYKKNFVQDMTQHQQNTIHRKINSYHSNNIDIENTNLNGSEDHHRCSGNHYIQKEFEFLFCLCFGSCWKSRCFGHNVGLRII